jgi:hypothetical protein
MTRTEFLNTCELDEWYQQMEDRAYDDDNSDDNDDYDLRSSYYPETLP